MYTAAKFCPSTYPGSRYYSPNRVIFPTTITFVPSLFFQGTFQTQLGWCHGKSVVCMQHTLTFPHEPNASRDINMWYPQIQNTFKGRGLIFKRLDYNCSTRPKPWRRQRPLWPSPSLALNRGMWRHAGAGRARPNIWGEVKKKTREFPGSGG